MFNQKVNVSKWFMRQAPTRNAKIRLFGFPCAGASASYFRAWLDQFPSEIDFCALQLPGRGNRYNEPLCSSLPELLNNLSEGLLPYLDIPFAFMGHSFGSLLCYELAKKLIAENSLVSRHLFISAYRAPSLTSDRKPIYMLPNDKFIRQFIPLSDTPLEIAENSEMMNLIVPIAKADLKICETYIEETGCVLPCPITVFGGVDDLFVNTQSLASWSAKTNKQFLMKLFSGNHHFIQEHQREIISIIKDTLINSL